MTLEEQIRKLSILMAQKEIEKMGIENSHVWSVMNKNNASNYASDEGFKWGMKRADEEGYKLSLEFNELLNSHGYAHSGYSLGPDCSAIAAENLLYKYGLKYPISWTYTTSNSDGTLNFDYESEEIIDSKHAQFLAEVEVLANSGKINDIDKVRITMAAEYFCNQHKLKTKYADRLGHQTKVLMPDTRTELEDYTK